MTTSITPATWSAITIGSRAGRAGREAPKTDHHRRQKERGAEREHRAHVLERLRIDQPLPHREDVVDRRRVEIRERGGEPGESGCEGDRPTGHGQPGQVVRRGGEARPKPIQRVHSGLRATIITARAGVSAVGQRRPNWVSHLPIGMG